MIEEDVPNGAKASDHFCAQIGAIMSLHRTDKCVGMYVLCMWLEELHAKNGPQWADLTPACVRYFAYQRNVHNKVHRQLLPVDYICAPAFVTPMSGNSLELSLKRPGDMFRVRLCGIDCQFFTRGGDEKTGRELHYYLRSKEDSFPQQYKRVLDFFMQGDMSPSSQDVHANYLPDFIADAFVYHDDMHHDPDLTNSNRGSRVAAHQQQEEADLSSINESDDGEEYSGDEYSGESDCSSP